MKEFIKELEKANLTDVDTDYYTDVEIVYSKIRKTYENKIGKGALLIEPKKSVLYVEIVKTTEHCVLVQKPFVHTKYKSIALGFINISISYNDLLCGRLNLEVI